VPNTYNDELQKTAKDQNDVVSTTIICDNTESTGCTDCTTDDSNLQATSINDSVTDVFEAPLRSIADRFAKHARLQQ
jgi:hypothetical protein